MRKPEAVRAVLFLIFMLFIGAYGCGGGGSNEEQPDGDSDNSSQPDGDRDTYIPPDGDRDSLTEDSDIENFEPDTEFEEPDIEEHIDGDDEIEEEEDLDFENAEADEIFEEDIEESDAEFSEGHEEETIDTDEDLLEGGEEEEIEQEEQTLCAADEIVLRSQLPLKISGSTLNQENDFIGEQCFSYDMPGDDYVYSIELQKLDILEIDLAPLEGSDFAVYILDSCLETQSFCTEAADTASAAENETLTFRIITEGVYYIVIDTKDAGSGGAYELNLSLGTDSGVPPGEPCDSHMDCGADSGAGFCIVKDRWEASFCTMECEEDSDCDGFESGCCMTISELGGKFCHLAKYCGVAGMTALPGEACATADYPNMPLCNPIAGAEYCEDDKHTPYCSHTCTEDSDCSDLTGGCCVKNSPAAGSGTCVPGSDCPHACTADVNVEHQNLPITITNKSTSSYDNRVSAYDCTFTGTPGRDVVFGVALNAGETLQATLSNATSFDGVLYVTGGCGWTLAECGAFADDSGFGGTETLHYAAASNGVYFVVVDSTNFAQSGSFRLNLQLVDTGIDGDEESGEIEDEISEDPTDGDSDGTVCSPLASYSRDELTASVSVNGSTAGATNDLQISGCGGAQQFGRDDYYAVEILAGDTLYALLDNTGDWDPSIAVYTDCMEGTCAKLTDSGLSAQDEQLTWTSSVNGTVYVVIDSPSPGSSGSYNLTLSLNEIIVDGDSDTDSGSSYLCQSSDYSDIGSYDDLAGDGFTETASTVGAANHSEIDTSQPNCLGTATPGPDKIYAIHLQYQQEIQITLSDVGDDFDPLLYISSLCGKPVICRSGSDEGGINEGEQIFFTAPANGTYYIVVDGPRNENDPSGGWYASGSYTLTITQATER